MRAMTACVCRSSTMAPSALSGSSGLPGRRVAAKAATFSMKAS
ncbi:Uncharacterised protein [Bordetella pertussis]|nr:Uncharacterised protein [Bordetella pertussis]CFP63608.1 Uncharacterised protein [Bordetella pertussis]